MQLIADWSRGKNNFAPTKSKPKQVFEGDWTRRSVKRGWPNACGGAERINHVKNQSPNKRILCSVEGNDKFWRSKPGGFQNSGRGSSGRHWSHHWISFGTKQVRAAYDKTNDPKNMISWSIRNKRLFFSCKLSIGFLNQTSWLHTRSPYKRHFLCWPTSLQHKTAWEIGSSGAVHSMSPHSGNSSARMPGCSVSNWITEKWQTSAAEDPGGRSSICQGDGRRLQLWNVVGLHLWRKSSLICGAKRLDNWSTPDPSSTTRTRTNTHTRSHLNQIILNGLHLWWQQSLWFEQNSAGLSGFFRPHFLFDILVWRKNVTNTVNLRHEGSFTVASVTTAHFTPEAARFFSFLVQILSLSNDKYLKLDLAPPTPKRNHRILILQGAGTHWAVVYTSHPDPEKPLRKRCHSAVTWRPRTNNAGTPRLTHPVGSRPSDTQKRSPLQWEETEICRLVWKANFLLLAISNMTGILFAARLHALSQCRTWGNSRLTGACRGLETVTSGEIHSPAFAQGHRNWIASHCRSPFAERGHLRTWSRSSAFVTNVIHFHWA